MNACAQHEDEQHDGCQNERRADLQTSFQRELPLSNLFAGRLWAHDSQDTPADLFTARTAPARYAIR